MQSIQSLSRRTCIGFVSVLLLFAAPGCDSGNTDSSSSDDNAPSVGEQVSAGSEKAGSDETEGTASIDNGGITTIPDDEALVDKGEKLFGKKGCKPCHQMNETVTGPALSGVTDRREPEWIARMILHPGEMLEKDPTAKKLLAKHATKMPNQNVSPDEAKAIIAYLATQ